MYLSLLLVLIWERLKGAWGYMRSSGCLIGMRRLLPVFVSGVLLIEWTWL
jgi:hypothetical protein